MAPTEHGNELKSSLPLEAVISESEGVPRKEVSQAIKKYVDNGSVVIVPDTSIAEFQKKIAEETDRKTHQFSTDKPFATYLTESKELVLPKGLIHSANYLGLTLGWLAGKYGISIFEYGDNEPLLTQDSEDQFWLGFSSMILHPTKVNLKASKKDYDLGRSVAYALLVKSEFESNQKLGLSALKRDNFFFGNNPTEFKDKASVPFFIKTRIRLIIKDESTFKAVYSVLIYLFREIGLSQFPEDQIDDIIKEHLVPFDDVARQNFREVTVTVNKKTKTVTRSPTFPDRSPLFQKVEMDFLKSLIQPLWDSMSKVKKNWLEAVYDEGFKALSARIHSHYSARWDLLAKFSKATTRRLQELRRAMEKPTLKKREVVTTDLDTYLTSLDSPANALAREIVYILPSSVYQEIGREVFRIIQISKETLIEELTIKIFAESVVKPIAADAEVKRTSSTDEMGKLLESTRRLAESYSKHRNIEANLLATARRSATFRGYNTGRLGMLVALTKSFFTNSEKLRNYDTEAIRVFEEYSVIGKEPYVTTLMRGEARVRKALKSLLQAAALERPDKQDREFLQELRVFVEEGV